MFGPFNFLWKWNSLYYPHAFLCGAVLDHTFQWLSTGVFGKFLSTWRRFLLVWTSLYMAWEGRVDEQVQNSGLPLFKFVDIRHFVLQDGNSVLYLLLFFYSEWVSVMTKLLQHCLLWLKISVPSHAPCFYINYSFYPVSLVLRTSEEVPGYFSFHSVFG